MARRLRSISMAALLALTFGCGGDDSDGPVNGGACDQRATLATCVEHGRGVDVGYSRGYCEAQGGTWLATGACPTADAFGRCTWPSRGGPGSVQYFYAGCTWCSGFPDDCTRQGGSWTPLP